MTVYEVVYWLDYYALYYISKLFTDEATAVEELPPAKDCELWPPIATAPSPTLNPWVED